MLKKKTFLFLFLFIIAFSTLHAQTRPSYLQINDSVAYLEQYGARANNSSYASQNVIAFNNAIAAKKTILVANTFYFDDTLELTDDTSLIGIIGTGQLRSYGISGKPLIKINGSNVKIKDLKITGLGSYSDLSSSGAAIPDNDGVFFASGLNCSISNCQITSFKGCGIRSNDTANSKINLSIKDCLVRYNYENGVRLGAVNSGKLDSCCIDFNRDYNIYIASSSSSITGTSLELGVSPLTDTLGLALYADGGSSATGRHNFTGLHIEDEYGSNEYYVATASRLVLVNLVRNTKLTDSYLKPGSGWISNAVQLGQSCEFTNNSIYGRSTTYPLTGIYILNITSSTEAPKISGNSISNVTTILDDTNTNAFKYYSEPKFQEIVLPYLFDCDGTGLITLGFPLSRYTASNRRVYAAAVYYATDSSAVSPSNGDFKIGSTAGGSEYFISSGTSQLEIKKLASTEKGLDIAEGTNLANFIYITLQQRSGQTLKFWVKLSLFN